MRPTTRPNCCQPLAAALSDEGRAAAGAALIVRAGPDGTLYFKITTGDHEFNEASVNEPASFCPFCGAPVSAADAPFQRPTEPLDDDELTVLACPATLVGV